MLQNEQNCVKLGKRRTPTTRVWKITPLKFFATKQAESALSGLPRPKQIGTRCSELAQESEEVPQAEAPLCPWVGSHTTRGHRRFSGVLHKRAPLVSSAGCSSSSDQKILPGVSEHPQHRTRVAIYAFMNGRVKKNLTPEFKHFPEESAADPLPNNKGIHLSQLSTKASCCSESFLQGQLWKSGYPATVGKNKQTKHTTPHTELFGWLGLFFKQEH